MCQLILCDGVCVRVGMCQLILCDGVCMSRLILCDGDHFSPAPGDPGLHRAVRAPGRETKLNIQVQNKVQVRMLKRAGEGEEERSSQKCQVHAWTLLLSISSHPHTLTPSPGLRRWERSR